MSNKNTFVKATVFFSLLSLVLFPVSAVEADSTTNSNVSASVVQNQSSSININGITVIKNAGLADGSYANGWKWIFDITIPNANENKLTMRFSNWTPQAVGSISIPVTNNLKFYSEHSSNANNTNNAILITGANSTSAIMDLSGGTISSGTRRINITVEMKIPFNTNLGNYSVNFTINSTQGLII